MGFVYSGGRRVPPGGSVHGPPVRLDGPRSRQHGAVRGSGARPSARAAGTLRLAPLDPLWTPLEPLQDPLGTPLRPPFVSGFQEGSGPRARAVLTFLRLLLSGAIGPDAHAALVDAAHDVLFLLEMLEIPLLAATSPGALAHANAWTFGASHVDAHAGGTPQGAAAALAILKASCLTHQRTE
eukprot:1633626-Pyramimonas_sp.AAC.3